MQKNQNFHKCIIQRSTSNERMTKTETFHPTFEGKTCLSLKTEFYVGMIQMSF